VCSLFIILHSESGLGRENYSRVSLSNYYRSDCMNQHKVKVRLCSFITSSNWGFLLVVWGVNETIFCQSNLLVMTRL